MQAPPDIKNQPAIQPVTYDIVGDEVVPVEDVEIQEESAGFVGKKIGYNCFYYTAQRRIYPAKTRHIETLKCKDLYILIEYEYKIMLFSLTNKHD